jgi:hypothetical protein
LRRWLFLVLWAWPIFAVAQPAVVVSSAPDTVGVTIYRNPNRGIDDKLELNNLQGFALISETRTVDLPPGPVTIRFEGVASGIEPQSALIFGSDVREKNRDAALLSERSLLDGFTGQSVILRRTDPKTGKRTEERATIRSGTQGVLVETARGIETVYCSGLENDLLFPGVPRGLSAKPTLSMTTKDQPGGRQTITLVYLSQRFDWQANYVGQFSPDATELDLFAWLTMASSDDTSFADATAAAVAGKVNRVDEDGDVAEADDAEPLNRRYGCWPNREDLRVFDVAEPATVSAPMEMMVAKGMLAEDANIVVTARRREAVREDLGDLKLYRIPFPVTVAARAQKQVAFLTKSRVKGAMLYRVRSTEDLTTPQMLFRFKNTKANGLGEALPAGKVALFQQAAGQRMLVGEASITDKTIDEDVDLVFGEASNVTVDEDTGQNGTDAKKRDWEDRVLTVRNANPTPIRFEAEFATNDIADFSRFTAKLEKRPGKTVWVVTVPANGEAVLRYRATDQE